MSEEQAGTKRSQDSTDILLWLGGLVVAGVGVSWLVLSQPWTSPSQPAPVAESSDAQSATPEPTAAANEVQPATQDAQPQLESTLDNPLRMARLAFEAGMLLEPLQFSAWSLYERVLEDEPEHPEALAGLAHVADELVRRGAVAYEQGRVDDARDMLEVILQALPNHSAAIGLAEEIGDPVSVPVAATAPVAPVVTPEPITARPTRLEAAEVAPRPAPEPPPVDPLVELKTAFDRAMADNRLLMPQDDNARYFAAVMSEMNSEADLVIEAREQLLAELLRRAQLATDTLDAEAARTWINHAGELGVDEAAVEQARASLTAGLIRAESLKPIPASQLTIQQYVAPRYPNRAATRGVEGWVDLEFVVGVDGTTRDTTVVDASDEEYFKEAAIAAVERWTFEPRVFMDQVIEQRAYTRIIFRVQ